MQRQFVGSSPTGTCLRDGRAQRLRTLVAVVGPFEIIQSERGCLPEA